MGSEYSADQIQILEGLEAVRKRPGMYIGSTSIRGLHHLVYEIVDNAVDEALAGFCDVIDVKIQEDNSITVIDNGRGIPVGINHKAGIPAVEVVFTILHAGGKFGGGGYKVSGGLHGVGASVVNALSEWLEVTIYHEGKVYRQRYERGKTIYKLKVIGECEQEKTGTMVSFLPDKEIFEETVFDFDTLKQRFREMAFRSAGNSPSGKRISRTGPVTCITFPMCFSLIYPSPYLIFFFQLPAPYVWLQTFCTSDNLRDFLSNACLAFPVIIQIQLIDHILGITGCFLHSISSCCQFACHTLTDTTVDQTSEIFRNNGVKHFHSIWFIQNQVTNSFFLIISLFFFCNVYQWKYRN